MNPVYSALLASNAVKALIGSNPMRAYGHGNAPQDVAKPYVTFQTISGSPTNNISENPDNDNSRIQVNCWSTQESQAKQLCDAVRDALEVQTHIVFGPLDDYEPDTTLFRWLLHCEWWLPR